MQREVLLHRSAARVRGQRAAVRVRLHGRATVPEDASLAPVGLQRDSRRLREGRLRVPTAADQRRRLVPRTLPLPAGHRRPRGGRSRYGGETTTGRTGGRQKGEIGAAVSRVGRRVLSKCESCGVCTFFLLVDLRIWKAIPLLSKTYYLMVYADTLPNCIPYHTKRRYKIVVSQIIIYTCHTRNGNVDLFGLKENRVRYSLAPSKVS